ncbi:MULTISPECIES: peptidoglycan recognition protein family protein [Streptomyces]|nr:MULTISPECIES: N-acetylmuramoyl-L-alanine amidase [Streptomyces]QEV11992.1 N-acetylmuramoyl-L-alanine amidase [Streptomyces fradiae ATCC 10745 = DSM 40063]UQS28375.1 N-acetylmuramoyl-L-alanine amidase [Streptomyces fradiae]
MAWYPGATRMELQPESDAQPAIRPTQFILHSIAAPWTARRMYEYWRDSSSLESHFGLGFEGDLAQYIGTETRADANYKANRRPDGTGAVSIETASNLKHTDPWTDRQIEQLIELGVWLHQHHGLPLRICRTHDDPGYGYHRLHSAWSSGGTACPGDARVKQFREIVFPGIVNRANGQTAPAPVEDDPVPNMLNEANTADMELQSGNWAGLSFRTAILLVGPVRHHTVVHLQFGDDTPSDTVIEGCFYTTDKNGGDRSLYLPIRAYGPGGHQFTSSADVGAGRHLRFMVRARTTDHRSVRLLHRAVTGPFWKL